MMCLLRDIEHGHATLLRHAAVHRNPARLGEIGRYCCETTVGGRPVVVEYEPDTELRDTEPEIHRYFYKPQPMRVERDSGGHLGAGEGDRRSS